jgi:DNA-binding beta-propeller fold protein YncE
MQVHSTNPHFTRRFPQWCAWLLVCALATLAGCTGASAGSSTPSEGRLDLVWGGPGTREGRFQKPRAIAIDSSDHLYIVDMRACIQVLDLDGQFIRQWRTPDSKLGRPTGLSIDNDGNLMVADTHYHQILFYTPQGEPLPAKTLGGKQGGRPGEFGFVTDVVQDSRGNYYVAEYGDFDRIQKFDAQGKFLFQWGGHGDALGQFARPQAIALDANDHLWVADSCNHRIQVFDATGSEAKLIRHWGHRGHQTGELYYPYAIALDGRGHVYLCEYGNHRIQKFTLDGQSLGCWGQEGRNDGELFNPWSLVLDSKGRLHVLDSNNHRIQRVIF